MGIKLIPPTLSKDNITSIQYNFDRLGPTDEDNTQSSLKIDDIEYKIIKKYNSVEDVDSVYSSVLVLDKNVPVYYKFNAIYICEGSMTPLSISINTANDSVSIYNYYIIAHFNSIIDDKLYIINAIAFNNLAYSSTNIFINTNIPDPLIPTNLSVNVANPITINNRSQIIDLINVDNYYIYNNNKNKIIYSINPIYAGLMLGYNQITDTTSYVMNNGLITVVPTSNTTEASYIQQSNNRIIKNENMPMFTNTGNNDIYIECGAPITPGTGDTGTVVSGTSNNSPKQDSKVFTIIIVLLVIIGLVTHLTMIIDNPNYTVTRNVEIFILFFLMFFPLTIF
jgi:hypothetical protein